MSFLRLFLSSRPSKARLLQSGILKWVVKYFISYAAQLEFFQGYARFLLKKFDLWWQRVTWVCPPFAFRERTFGCDLGEHLVKTNQQGAIIFRRRSMELERLHSRLKCFNKTPSPFSSSGIGKMCRGDREKWHRRWDLSSLRHVIQHSETQVALFHFQTITLAWRALAVHLVPQQREFKGKFANLWI